LKLLYTPSLPKQLSNSRLLLDTTTLINASKSGDLLKLLAEISNSGCMLVTIPSVVYEFTRGVESIEQYNNQMIFIEKLGVTVISRAEEKITPDMRVFMILYNSLVAKRREKGPSYTDSLLCAMAYKYRKSGGLMIITANHKDIPLALFDREEMITVEINNEFRTESIYKLSNEKLDVQIDTL